MTTKTQTLTDTMIRNLRDEAGNAGDSETVEICTAALAGDQAARGACATLITDARAMDDSEPLVVVVP